MSVKKIVAGHNNTIGGPHSARMFETPGVEIYVKNTKKLYFICITEQEFFLDQASNENGPASFKT